MNFLNLPGWQISKIDQTEDNYTVTAGPLDPPHACPHCGAARFVGFGKKEQTVLDLPSHGKRVGIVIPRRRYRCKACTRTFLEPIAELEEHRHATKRLVDYIEKQSLRRTFASIAEEVGFDEYTVRSIFKAYTQRLSQAVTFETPEYMGLDEVHLVNQMRCVITNVRERTILDLLADRSKKTVVKYLANMRDHDRIQVVTLDMWVPYKEAVKEVLSQARMVIDKFHVVRMANDALDQVRKNIRATLTDRQRRTLMKDRKMLLKRRSELSEQETFVLETWTGNFPLLADAYSLKELFYSIYTEASNRSEALKAYQLWQSAIPPELEEAFSPITTAVANWQEEILNYFDDALRPTNAYTESLNALITATNRARRGYSFEALRAKMLYSQGLHKERRPNYKTKQKRGVKPVVTASSLDRVDYLPESSLGVDMSTVTHMLLNMDEG